jgi:hypothetical protein
MTVECRILFGAGEMRVPKGNGKVFGVDYIHEGHLNG